MAVDFTRLELKPGFRRSFPAGGAQAGKPIVVLLHGLGGDRADWQNPFQERNWPYDHRTRPPRIALGTLSTPPQADFLGLGFRNFLSPLLAGNANGADGSDDRSWWHALVRAGFPVLTYSQRGGEMVPFSQGPVAEFKQFMATLQADVLADPAFQSRPVVIIGHSRGGLIGRAYLGDPDVKANSSREYPNVTGLATLSSPHAGSNMAWLDDRIVHLL
jgi:pimeloyl-ACP methyl ester carboxylesterase